LEAVLLVSHTLYLNPTVSDAKPLGRSLVILDRSLSTLLGRPCVLQDEESVLLSHQLLDTEPRSFDTDLPLICDDEDLDESGLKSPLHPDLPTQMSGFVCMIKLSQIIAFALRTVVSRRLGHVSPN
jgi:hypothetical protein